MLDFILFYLGFGVFLSIIINALQWSVYRPQLSAIEVLACILLWPNVVSSFINSMNGIEEEVED